MAEVETVDVVLNADVSRFASGLASANSSLMGVSNSVKGVSTSASGLLGLNFGQVVSAVEGIADQAINAYANVQQIQIAFETLTGSADKANQMISQINEFPWAVPIENIEQMAQKMLGIGFSADTVIPTLQAVNDAAASLHLGASGAESIVTALGRIKSTGQVTAMSFRPFITQGIDAWGMLANYLGVSVTQAEEMVKKHGVSAAQGIAALTKGLTNEFSKGAAESQSSITGSFTRIKNDATVILQGLGKEIATAFNFSGTNSSIVGFADRLVKLTDQTKSVTKALGIMIPPGVADTITIIAGAITATLIPSLIRLGVSASLSAIAFSPWLILGGLIAGVALLLYNHFKQLEPVILIIGGAVAGILVAAFVAFLPVLTAVAAEAIAATIALLGFLAPFIIIGALVGTVAYLVISHWSEVKKFFQTLWTNIINDAKAFPGQITAIIGVLKSEGEKIINGFKNDWNVFVSQLNAIPGKIAGSLVTPLMAIWAKIQTDITYAIGLVELGWKNFVSFIGSIPKKVETFINQLPYLVGFALGLTLKIIILGAVAIYEGIVNTLKPIPGEVSKFFTDLYKSAVTIWNNVTTYLDNKAQEIYTDIVTELKDLPNQIQSLFTDIYNTGVTWWTNIWSYVTTKAQALYSDVTTEIAKLPGQVESFFRNMYSGVTSTVNSMVSAVINYVSSLPGRVSSYLSNLVANGRSSAQSFYNGIANPISEIPGIFTNIFNRVVSFVSGLPGRLLTIAKNIGNQFWQGFKSGLGISSPSYIERAFMAIGDQAQATLDQLSGLKPKMQSVATGLAAGFNTGIAITPTYATAPASPLTNNPMVGMKSGGITGAFVPAPTGGPTSPGQTPIGSPSANNGTGIVFNIQQVVVREEADIQKIAQALFRKTQDRLRGRGQRS